MISSRLYFPSIVHFDRILHVTDIFFIDSKRTLQRFCVLHNIKRYDDNLTVEQVAIAIEVCQKYVSYFNSWFLILAHAQ